MNNTKVPQRVLDSVSCSTDSYWAQHSNGNGWVYKTAKVEPSVYLHPTSIVFGDARVSGDAQVFGNARVSGNARVYGEARVFGDAQVSGDAQVFVNARVSGNARVFGDAWVSGNAWVQSPLQIQGSRHFVTLCSLEQIAIGCHVHDFEYWEKHFKAIGRAEGYTTEEVKEYYLYITACIAFAKSMKARTEAKK
jgi:carbonic anhydrase/acetyltransferase-like protein (isoleucine patch superfamily)